MNEYANKQLLVNFLLGICTERERQKVEQWLNDAPENAELLKQTASHLRGGKTYALPDMEEVRNELLQKIGRFEGNSFGAAGMVGGCRINSRQFHWVRAAAIFLVILLSGLATYFIANDINSEVDRIVQESDAVFKQSMLADGQTASLYFGDGSVIQLNAGSSLRYPEKFALDKREVYLSGEAFFTISRDENRPFIVYAGNTITHVLGTSFNIRAYDGDDKLQVVVAEGKVAVTQAPATQKSNPDGLKSSGLIDDEKVILLERNQWMTYHTKSEIIERGEGDIRELIAWKDRVLVFRSMPFRDVAGMLERWYGVKFKIENPDLENHVLEGEHHDVSLEEVLKSIQFVMDFEYSINGNEIIIR